MLKNCAVFHHLRFLQVNHRLSLLLFLLVFSVQTLCAVMEHAKFEQIDFGAPYMLLLMSLRRFTFPSKGPLLQGNVNPAKTASLSCCTPVTKDSNASR